MSAAVAQLRLLDAPLASLVIMEPSEANDLLVEWGHRLGPVHRPFRMEAYALALNGRPLSVAVSASTVSSHVAGWLKPSRKEEPIRFERQEVVELARLASSPDALWATRVMLRLWREVCAHQWACWPVRAAVSYSHNALHAGDLYRFDGWTRINDRCGSSGGAPTPVRAMPPTQSTGVRACGCTATKEWARDLGLPKHRAGQEAALPGVRQRGRGESVVAVREIPLRRVLSELPGALGARAEG